jgi:hypothetical protein
MYWFEMGSFTRSKPVGVAGVWPSIRPEGVVIAAAIATMRKQRVLLIFRILFFLTILSENLASNWTGEKTQNVTEENGG